MKLFEFTPNETGYDSFYIMSETEEEALKNLCKLKQFNMDFWNKYKHKYIITTYKVNESTWSDNC